MLSLRLLCDAQADHEGPILLLLLATCFTTINALTSITDLTRYTAVLPASVLALFWWLKPSRGIRIQNLVSSGLFLFYSWLPVLPPEFYHHQRSYQNLATINAHTIITDLTIVTAVLPLLQLLPASVFVLCYQQFMTMTRKRNGLTPPPMGPEPCLRMYHLPCISF